MITDLRSFLKVSCRTKFRFDEPEAQRILGECGPLNFQSWSGLAQYLQSLKQQVVRMY